MYDNTHTFPPQQRSLLEEAAIVHHVNGLLSSGGGEGIFTDASVKQYYPFIDRYQFDCPPATTQDNAADLLPEELQTMLQESMKGDKAAFFKAFRAHIFSDKNQASYQSIVDSFAERVQETEMERAGTSIFKNDDGYFINFKSEGEPNWAANRTQMQVWLEAQKKREEPEKTIIDVEYNYITVQNPGEAIDAACAAAQPSELTPADIRHSHVSAPAIINTPAPVSTNG
jgi:hypothetical protein